MIAAVVVSTLFLISYLSYHAQHGSMPYGGYGYLRYIYFLVLIPHILLATLMLPFVLAALWFASKKQFDRHKKVTRWLWPVWMYVSVSGVVVYLMLYVF